MRRPDTAREESALLQVLGGDLLDALAAQIAVLDAKGRVVAVNERTLFWRAPTTISKANSALLLYTTS